MAVPVRVPVREEGERVVFGVRCKPRASRSGVDGIDPRTAALSVRLAAPPVDGAANEELVRFLAREVLGVAPSAVTVVSGSTGRHKRVAVVGLTAAEVQARLGVALDARSG